MKMQVAEGTSMEPASFMYVAKMLILIIGGMTTVGILFAMGVGL